MLVVDQIKSHVTNNLTKKEGILPHWYGCNSLSSKSILSKSKLYCKSPNMEEIKQWVSEEENSRVSS